MLNISFLDCARVLGPDSLYCGKWGNFEGPHTVILTLIRQCSILNLSELFSYTITYSNCVHTTENNVVVYGDSSDQFDIWYFPLTV